jgi:hypothetical protein
MESPKKFMSRMIHQALHADKRLNKLGKQGMIIIKTSDTDVIVLCIYFDKTNFQGPLMGYFD